MQVYRPMCVHGHVEFGCCHGMSFSNTLPLSFRDGVSLDPELTGSTRVAGYEAPRSPHPQCSRQACGQTLVYVPIVALEHSEMYLKLCVNSNLKGGNQYCDGLSMMRGPTRGWVLGIHSEEVPWVPFIENKKKFSPSTKPRTPGFPAPL